MTVLGTAITGFLAFAFLFRSLPDPVHIHKRSIKQDKVKPKVSPLGKFKHAAVSVDSIPCAQIGNDILLQGGNAFDSAVAAMYCNSVVNSQSMGLGGGFIMVMTLENGTRLALNARETAPAKASRGMYRGITNLTHFGPLASGIPGFVAGTWELKQKLGNPNITWKSLLQPSIDLCFNGITVNSHAEFFGKKVKGSLKRDPGLTSMFIDQKTGTVRKEGEVYTFPLLGATLKKIARNGAREFYGGYTGQKLVKDIKKAGGIITIQDLKNYRVVWDKPIAFELKNSGYTVVTSPPPGSGAITAAILGIMDLFSPSPPDLHRTKTWHRFAEAAKFGYARKTHLADWSFNSISDFVHGVVDELLSEEWIKKTKESIDDSRTYNDPLHYGAEYVEEEDHGTCHMNFLDPAGNAVAVTASINLIYGSKYMSPTTGVVMNNQMDDFANPNIVSAYKLQPSPNNYIAPGKRPMSSISTTIVLDKKNNVVAIAGASGGTKIITAVAQVLLRTLYLGQNVQQAVDEPRFHHQLLPMELWYEEGCSKLQVKELARKGHEMTFFPTGGSAVQAILVDQDTGITTATADYRKGGAVFGF